MARAAARDALGVHVPVLCPGGGADVGRAVATAVVETLLALAPVGFAARVIHAGAHVATSFEPRSGAGVAVMYCVAPLVRPLIWIVYVPAAVNVCDAEASGT
jgi:hypothetical protein